MDGMSGIDASEMPAGFTAGDPNKGGANKGAENAARVIAILEQILDGPAYERLKRIKLVRKEKAAQIEAQLVNAAMNGTLQGKISEAKLIEMIEGGDKAGGGGGGGPKIAIQRKNYGFDGDDDDDNDDDLM